MRFSSIVAPIGLIGLASAAPSIAARGYPGDSCIPYATAIGIQTEFISTLTNFSADVASNLLAPTFTDTSDSINYIAGMPLGTFTFPNPQAFIGGQGSQPPIGLTILGTDVVTCDGIIVFRWVAQVGIQKFPAQGITILKSIKSGSDNSQIGPGGWQLNAVYSEFNSAAWIEDFGGSCPPPTAPSRLFKA